ncbi:hypothetical protein BC829DRAFT_437832 [Chytridium lagenaria]|nr:hypothetical protein BC829DRAFT_437832 [Chytridium lagenaria]
MIEPVGVTHFPIFVCARLSVEVKRDGVVEQRLLRRVIGVSVATHKIRCDSTGRITGLGLANTQLSGVVPPELGNLSNLRLLFLYNNQLEGTIPPQLGNLSNLQVLHLFNNQLTGAIPAQLGNLNNLRELGLYNNQLAGAVPPQLGNLNNLWQLYLENNYLSGAVPEYVSNLSSKSIEGNCFSDIRNSAAYSNITQRSEEDCQRNSPGFTPSSFSTVTTDTSAPSNSAAPGTSISPETSNTATSNVVSPGLITGIVLGIIVLLGLVKPSSTCPPKIDDLEARVTRPSLPITNLRSEPLPPPDDPRDSKSTFFSGLNAIPTASSSRIDKDYNVVPAVTDVQNEKAEELTLLGSMTLDGTQANEARMDRVIAPARGSSMMVVTSGAAQRSRSNVASWSCEDVEPIKLTDINFFCFRRIDLLNGITVVTMRDNLLYAVERLRVPMSPGIGVSTAGSMTFANDAPPQYS